MPMQLPEGTIAVGQHAYLFVSPAEGMQDCMILAHGGAIDLSRRFDVPSDMEVIFYTDAGRSITMGRGPLKYYEGKTGNLQMPAANLRYNSGRPCPDYVLGKSVGTHWKVEAERSTYTDIRRSIDNLAAPGSGANWV